MTTFGRSSLPLPLPFDSVWALGFKMKHVNYGGGQCLGLGLTREPLESSGEKHECKYKKNMN